MTVTIKDIADKAGVSTMTVSRALRDSPLVAAETRMRILRVAEELGYSPNLLARSLVRQKSPVIGLVVTELANPFFTPIINAVQAKARGKGFVVVIGDSERKVDYEEEWYNLFRQMRVSGLVVTPLDTDSPMLKTWRKSGFPVVVVARRWEGGDSIIVDNLKGGRMVGTHLLSLGHRSISCVTLNEPKNTAVKDREQGFRDTLTEAGVDCPKEWVFSTETLRVEEGARVADAFLERTPRPSAVFVTADRLAIGFIHRLLERGIKVPAEVAVVGYDDIRYSAFIKVPLTTVSLPTRELGEQAAELIFERIEHPVGPRAKPRHVLLQPTLVIRESCGGMGKGIAP